jgi:Flp pilus assembly protein TadB
MATMSEGPEPKFTPLDEKERLPRELLPQPWYARLSGRPVYMGFAWLVAFPVVLVVSWWLTHSVIVVAIAVAFMLVVFWWLTRK